MAALGVVVLRALGVIVSHGACLPAELQRACVLVYVYCHDIIVDGSLRERTGDAARLNSRAH